MALKDLKWTIAGDVTIDGDDDGNPVAISNPVIRIGSFSYRPENRKIRIELIANENLGIHQHSRTFTFDVPGVANEQFTVANIKAFIEAKFPAFVVVV